MGKTIIIRGADFKKTAIYNAFAGSIFLSDDNYIAKGYLFDSQLKSYVMKPEYVSTRTVLYYGLVNDVIKNASHISVSITGPGIYKIARQYWSKLGNGEITSIHTTLGDFISDSTSWESSFSEDIPSNAKAIALVINGDNADLSNIVLRVKFS